MSASTSVHEIAVPPTLQPRSIAQLLDALVARSDARVVVLRGGDDRFCDGLDLATAGREADLAAAVHAFARALLTLRRLDRPTLAFVGGSARGGGVGLLAACDVVIAGPHASFGLPEGLFGLTPAVVGPFVAERIGEPTLRRLVLTASSIDAREAQRLGLVDEVADDAVSLVVQRYVRALSRTASVAARLKRCGGPSPAVVQSGAEATLARLRDPATASRIRAFVDDGVAPWEVGR